MATHKPLPAGPLDNPDVRANRRSAVQQAHQNALSAYQRNAFHMLDPRFSVPGIFHAYQTGEAPGQYGEDVSLNVPEYSIDLIRRYPYLSPTEQLRVRWAVSMKASWSYEELLEYRAAAFGFQRRPGDNPYADVAPYDVSMVVRYPWMTPAQQMKVRYSVSQKEEWTPDELEAYRRAAFGGFPYARPSSAVGPLHLGRVGETANAYYGPRQAANAFERLGSAMEGVAGQARRAGEGMRELMTKLPRDLPSDPAHDASTLGGWGIPDDKRITL